MATTFKALKRFLDQAGLKYETYQEHNVIAIGFKSDEDDNTYRDADGDAHVQVLVRLAEAGEFCVAMVPRTWSLAGCEHRAAVCEAATRVQSKLKLIRFDLDDEDHIQANVEIPLEKSRMCGEQLHRAVACLLIAVRQFDPVIRHAMQTGEVDLELAREDDKPEPDADITRVLELGEAAGGLDALERLLGDSDAPPIQA